MSAELDVAHTAPIRNEEPVYATKRARALEKQKAAASEWMAVIGYLPRSYEPELHGIVEDAFLAGLQLEAGDLNHQAEPVSVVRMASSLVACRDAAIRLSRCIDAMWNDPAGRVVGEKHAKAICKAQQELKVVLEGGQ